jgi:hypothetical protein
MQNLSFFMAGVVSSFMSENMETNACRCFHYPKSEDQLVEAVVSCHPFCLHVILASGRHTTWGNPQIMLALKEAVWHKPDRFRLAVVRTLVKCVLPSMWSDSLYFACLHGHFEYILLLVPRLLTELTFYDVLCQIFYLAFTRRHFAIVHWLLRQSQWWTDGDKVNALRDALHRKYWGLCELLWEYFHQSYHKIYQNPLPLTVDNDHLSFQICNANQVRLAKSMIFYNILSAEQCISGALQGGDVDLVKYLRQNHVGITPEHIFLAIWHQNLPVVQYFFQEFESDIRAWNLEYCRPDFYGKKKNMFGTGLTRCWKNQYAAARFCDWMFRYFAKLSEKNIDIMLKEIANNIVYQGCEYFMLWVPYLPYLSRASFTESQLQIAMERVCNRSFFQYLVDWFPEQVKKNIQMYWRECHTPFLEDYLTSGASLDWFRFLGSDKLKKVKDRHRAKERQAGRVLSSWLSTYVVKCVVCPFLAWSNSLYVRIQRYR